MGVRPAREEKYAAGSEHQAVGSGSYQCKNIVY